jgi:hypothetical protein
VQIRTNNKINDDEPEARRVTYGIAPRNLTGDEECAFYQNGYPTPPDMRTLTGWRLSAGGIWIHTGAVVAHDTVGAVGTRPPRYAHAGAAEQSALGNPPHPAFDHIIPIEVVDGSWSSPAMTPALSRRATGKPFRARAVVMSDGANLHAVMAHISNDQLRLCRHRHQDLVTGGGSLVDDTGGVGTSTGPSRIVKEVKEESAGQGSGDAYKRGLPHHKQSNTQHRTHISISPSTSSPSSSSPPARAP